MESGGVGGCVGRRSCGDVVVVVIVVVREEVEVEGATEKGAGPGECEDADVGVIEGGGDVGFG
ncbi:hypothetical protein Hanom_Chr02g00157261 [Helianthus anomalus]